MHRLLLVVAIAAGCGDVGAVPDARMASDGPAAPDASDAPPAVDLMRGCVMKALMNEASWLGSGRPVLNACGTSTGVVVGTGPDTIDSDRGRVGSFSGESCVDFPSSAELHGTTGLTMSAWVRPTGLNGVDSNGVITKRNDRNQESEYGLFVWTGSKVYVDLGDLDRYQGTATLLNDTWFRLTAVFDSSRAGNDRVRLFINGVADPLVHTTIGNLGDTLPSYDAPLHLGCTPAPTTADPPTQQTFQGQLDDVTIWNRALSDAELAALFAGP
jgi:hypothetical protein